MSQYCSAGTYILFTYFVLLSRTFLIKLPSLKLRAELRFILIVKDPGDIRGRMSNNSCLIALPHPLHFHLMSIRVLDNVCIELCISKSVSLTSSVYASNSATVAISTKIKDRLP